MGAISSCFGRGRSPEVNDDETRRLLQDSYSRTGYGGTGNIGGEQPDSESARREREALEGIYHSLSDNVLDVFTAQPQEQAPMSAAPPKESGLGYDNDDDLASEEMRMRTIKKGRSGAVFSSMNKAGMKAVHAAIG